MDVWNTKAECKYQNEGLRQSLKDYTAEKKARDYFDDQRFASVFYESKRTDESVPDIFQRISCFS